MTKYLLKLFFASLGITLVVLSSCKKNNLVVDQDVVPPTYAKFNTALNDTMATYFIKVTEETFTLPIGITTVSDKDRQVQFTYTSTAAQGAQYNAPSSITIPAGKALDSLTISGIFAGYSSTSRVDTLLIQITGADVPASPYKGYYKLILRKQCPINLDDFLGDYANTNEFLTSAYGPYTTSISSVNLTGPTTGTIVVENIWDNGWGAITFDLDWSDPDNPTVLAEPLDPIPGSNAADVGYTGTMAERPFASGNVGTFSACNNTFTLIMQLGVSGLGYFPNVYTVNMAR